MTDKDLEAELRLQDAARSILTPHMAALAKSLPKGWDALTIVGGKVGKGGAVFALSTDRDRMAGIVRGWLEEYDREQAKLNGRPG